MADETIPSGNLRAGSPRISPDDASSQALSEALGSSLVLIRILGAFLLAAFVFSCVFTVKPNEVAVVWPAESAQLAAAQYSTRHSVRAHSGLEAEATVQLFQVTVV